MSTEEQQKKNPLGYLWIIIIAVILMILVWLYFEHISPL